MGKIFVESNTGRFANQLFPLFRALTIYEENLGRFDKILFESDSSYGGCRLTQDIIKRLPKQILNVVSFDTNEYRKEFEKYTVGVDEYIDGYCQDLTLINIDVVKRYFECPSHIKSTIFELYGDITELVCIHVRRGDFLSDAYKDIFISPTKEYIDRCIEKYYANDKFIVISDDIEWCKSNLSNHEVIFADKCDDYLIDFYIQTLTKGNILSASSWSIAGAIISPYRKCVMPNRLMNIDGGDSFNMFPDWAIRENI